MIKYFALHKLFFFNQVHQLLTVIFMAFYALYDIRYSLISYSLYHIVITYKHNFRLVETSHLHIGIDQVDTK